MVRTLDSLVLRLRANFNAWQNRSWLLKNGVRTAWSLAVIASWVPMIAWLRINVVDITLVNGPSMYPFLNGERNSTLRRDVLLSYNWFAQENLQRGMVVFLRSPNDPEKIAVKRIIGLEGDVVQTRPPYPVPTVTVPRGHVWVEGDNEGGNTIDSNTYGPASAQLIVGRATHVLYPLHKFGQIKWWEHKRALQEPRKA